MFQEISGDKDIRGCVDSLRHETGLPGDWISERLDFQELGFPGAWISNAFMVFVRTTVQST
jgi:hypothetical protein